MSVPEAVFVKLAAQPALMALIGTAEDGSPLMFQDTLLMTDEYLENSQKVAIVITHRGEWTTPNRHNSLKFPRVLIDIYADPDRDADGTPLSTTNARDKVIAVADLLIKIFNRSEYFNEQWAGEWVMGSHHLRGPEWQPLREGGGLMFGTVIVGLETS